MSTGPRESAGSPEISRVLPPLSGVTPTPPRLPVTPRAQAETPAAGPTDHVELRSTPAPVPPGAREQGQKTALQAAGAAVGGPAGLQLAQLADLAGRRQLETKASYLESINRAEQGMKGESGIQDLPQGVPTLVLSDIHARRDFLLKALEHQVDGKKVFDLLKAGKLNVVCVGDGMHGEGRAAARWLQAEEDLLNGRPSAALHEEMVEGFGTMKMVMELKAAFPEHFHFVRGNHDEIKGNFMKYARRLGEAPMVRAWTAATFGPDFVESFARFEESLPLVVRGKGFVASHSAPGGVLQKDAVQARDPKSFAQLSWTENRGWDDRDPGLQRQFQQNLHEVGGDGGFWLVGHRPVEQGLYRSQFHNGLVQINAPDDFVVALVPADGKFEPGRDIFSLK